MAIEKVYLSEGVSQSIFDTHTHNYRKITQLGVDQTAWGNPVRVNVIDNAEVHAEDGTDLESVGVTVAILPTSTPV